MKYDSASDNIFTANNPKGGSWNFRASGQGMYYTDLSAPFNSSLLINTVADNMSNYTKRDYLKASLAKQIQKILAGQPPSHSSK